MITPRKGGVTKKRPQHHAYQHAQQSSKQAPATHHLYIVGSLVHIASIVVFRNMAHRAHRNTQVSSLRYQLYRGIKERHQAHATRTQQHGHKLIAHKTYQHIQALHTAKNTRVFQHMAITIVALYVHIYIKTNAIEKALAEYLKVPYISLFTNGTLPLLTALQALRITGEVITTPYSFVATTHSIWWNGCKPVFVDIEEETCGIDPDKIEAAITPKTTAIMPVHCYGKPVKTKQIQEIADKYGLKVIYDAAHAFGVEVDGESVLNAGDMSTLSFHATKVYNTLEGGALVVHDEQTKKRIDYLKNFGFAGETEVVAPGINSKVDEVRAAYGLLNLKQVDAAIANRQKVAKTYRDALRNVPGLRFFEDMPGVRHN